MTAVNSNSGYGAEAGTEMDTGNDAGMQMEIEENTGVEREGTKEGSFFYEPEAAEPKSFKGVEHDDAKRMQITMPDEYASIEEVEAFYDRLGRPDSPQGYQLPIPDGEDGTFAEAVAPLLYRAGLSQQQAQVLAHGWNQLQANYAEMLEETQFQQNRQLQAQNQQQAEALRNEWGRAYEGNLELARRGRAMFFPTEQADAITNAIEQTIGLKGTLELFYEIGKGMAEDNAAGLSGRGVNEQRGAAEVLFDNHPKY